MMHPQIAMTLADQRRDELIRQNAEARQARAAGTSWLGRHLPRWHVSWTRTVLSSAAAPGTVGSGHPGRRGERGSSLVIIISSYH
jgi:hypothetical protein